MANDFLRRVEPIDERYLLDIKDSELELIYQASPAGGLPQGSLAGTAIVLPGSPFNAALAAAVRNTLWKGAVLDSDGAGVLTNRVTPFGAEAIRGAVNKSTSFIDGRPCTLVDYSRTSNIAWFMRGEIRLVTPQLYLGAVFIGGRRLWWFAMRAESRRSTRESLEILTQY